MVLIACFAGSLFCEGQRDWHFPMQECHMSDEDELLHNIESLSNQLAGNFLPV